MAEEKKFTGSSKADDDIQTIRIPSIGSLLFRGTAASKDQRFVNGFFDVLKNPETQKTYYYFNKRWGLTQTGGIRPPAGNGTARGCYSWNGKLYSCYGTSLYSGTTDLGVTLTSSTGLCGFAETRSGAGTRYLGINDGIKLFLIATDDTVTTVTTNYPTPNTRDLQYMDGYFFVLQNTGVHYHCTVDDPTSWDVTKFLTAQMYSADINKAGIGMARLGNYLVQFSEKHEQVFYDAANSSGSALSNVEQLANQIGCASTDSIEQLEDRIIWVSNLGKAGLSVHMLSEQGGAREVATPAIKRILQAEGTSISTCVAFIVQQGGHALYVLNLDSANRTFVYDYKEDLWVEWEVAAGGAKWPIVASCQHGNALICQHATNGWLYVMSPTIYQDDTVNFTWLMRLGRVDFGTNQYKFAKSLDIIGDIQSSTTNVSLQYSDDDWTTLSTARTLNMALSRAFAMNLGMFRRRSFQLSYAGNNPLRVEALELRIKLGA